MRKFFARPSLPETPPREERSGPAPAGAARPARHGPPTLPQAPPFDATMAVDYQALIAAAEATPGLVESPTLGVSYTAAMLAAPPPEVEAVVPLLDDPEAIGQYKVHGRLGEGGMAIVYLCEHPGQPGWPFAVKIMRAAEEDPEPFQRFEREILIGLQLRHPNICQVVDWGRTEDHHFYLVMELLQGETLAAAIGRSAPMPLEVVGPLVRQILTGLDAIHGQGIVHRDLKPVNIFVTTEGTVKIMDFGIAQSRDYASVTRTGTSLGTVHYMSPEQLKDTKHVDLRTDLFNVGVITYQMLSGHLPIEGPLSSVVIGLVQGTMKPIAEWCPELPGEVQEWIHRLMRRRKDHRYQSAREALEHMPF